jgi:hypothetical protein
MKNPKKHNKGPRMRRNALPAAIARLTRSAPRRRAPTAEEIESASSASKKEDSNGVRLIKALGGGLGTTIVGSLLEHQATVPAKWVSLGIAGLGAALAYGSPNKTLRSVGVGAAAAGTSLLGRTIIDEELFRREEKKNEDKPKLASGSPPPKPPAPGKTHSNASDIPADALARAYERARLRMALASDAPN